MRRPPHKADRGVTMVEFFEQVYSPVIAGKCERVEVEGCMRIAEA